MRISAFVVLFGLLLSACSSTHQISAQSGLDVHTFTHDSINTHLLVANGAMVMVDPGYEKNASVLEQDLRDAGFDPALVKTIVLTHGHADHAGAARHFQARFQARVVAGQGDEGMLGGGKNEPLCPTSGISAPSRAKTSPIISAYRRALDVAPAPPQPTSAPAGPASTGKENENVVVSPGTLRASIRPPCASTRPRTM